MGVAPATATKAQLRSMNGRPAFLLMAAMLALLFTWAVALFSVTAISALDAGHLGSWGVSLLQSVRSVRPSVMAAVASALTLIGAVTLLIRKLVAQRRAEQGSKKNA